MRMKGVQKGTVVQKFGGYMRNIRSGASSTCLQSPVVSQFITGLGPSYVRVQLLFE